MKKLADFSFRPPISFSHFFADFLAKNWLKIFGGLDVKSANIVTRQLSPVTAAKEIMKNINIIPDHSYKRFCNTHFRKIAT